MKDQKRLKIILQLAGAALGTWLFFRLFAPILLPFVLGLLPALAAQKASARLQERIRMPRWLAASLCVGLFYITVFLSIWLLGKILLTELEHFFRSLPALAGELTEPLHRLENSMLRLASRFPDGIGAAMEQWTQDFFSSGAGLGSKLYDRVFSLVSGILRRMPDLALFFLTALLSGFMLAI